MHCSWSETVLTKALARRYRHQLSGLYAPSREDGGNSVWVGVLRVIGIAPGQEE